MSKHDKPQPTPVVFSISQYLGKKRLQVKQHKVLQSKDKEFKIHVWGTEAQTLTLEEREKHFNAWQAHAESFKEMLTIQKAKIENYNRLSNGDPL